MSIRVPLDSSKIAAPDFDVSVFLKDSLRKVLSLDELKLELTDVLESNRDQIVEVVESECGKMMELAAEFAPRDSAAVLRDWLGQLTSEINKARVQANDVSVEVSSAIEESRASGARAELLRAARAGLEVLACADTILDSQLATPDLATLPTAAQLLRRARHALGPHRAPLAVLARRLDQAEGKLRSQLVAAADAKLRDWRKSVSQDTLRDLLLAFHYSDVQPPFELFVRTRVVGPALVQIFAEDREASATFAELLRFFREDLGQFWAFGEGIFPFTSACFLPEAESSLAELRPILYSPGMEESFIRAFSACSEFAASLKALIAGRVPAGEASRVRAGLGRLLSKWNLDMFYDLRLREVQQKATALLEGPSFFDFVGVANSGKGSDTSFVFRGSRPYLAFIESLWADELLLPELYANCLAGSAELVSGLAAFLEKSVSAEKGALGTASAAKLLYAAHDSAVLIDRVKRSMVPSIAARMAALLPTPEESVADVFASSLASLKRVTELVRGRVTDKLTAECADNLRGSIGTLYSRLGTDSAGDAHAASYRTTVLDPAVSFFAREETLALLGPAEAGAWLRAVVEGVLERYLQRVVDANQTIDTLRALQFGAEEEQSGGRDLVRGQIRADAVAFGQLVEEQLGVPPDTVSGFRELMAAVAADAGK